MSETRAGGNRPLFVATILTGSFLLFLVQPMVARMALPRLGGAPAVWNSAMLVYQALLLAGYFYAHRLGKMALARQARIHVVLLALGALTLPVALADLPAPSPGTEVLWVPALLALTIGPVFFLVSAQAPLMQRWYATDPKAGEPWALYAASNLGSFGGLIAYPLLAEPLLSVHLQSIGWTVGYGLLVVLVLLCARARRAMADTIAAVEAVTSPPVPARRIVLWLLLAAVPSGLMLSTTTHLTTDLVAMPLLWVIPLGIYLLSFVTAFSDNRRPARVLSALTWPVILVAGGFAMVSQGSVGLIPAIASIALLYFVCVSLHGRMYDLRPASDRLTLFYLVMSAGGALGGMFTALVAPVVFDWAWEHPILVFAAAALLPLDAMPDWRRLKGLEPAMARLAMLTILVFAGFLLWLLYSVTLESDFGWKRWGLSAAIALCGLALVQMRGPVLLVLVATMIVQGGFQTLADTRDGVRHRSYFGIYTVRTYEDRKVRTLAHGTTLHGEQLLDGPRRRQPLTYYGPGSGAGIAFANAPVLFGDAARIGVVGLGTGSLACYKQPAMSLTYYEIDPTVLAYSRNGTFSFISECAPDARMVIGDARLELAKAPKASFDLLAIDAFSSDSIPLHLVTREAFRVYMDALSPRGVLLVHISNRFIELEPVIAAGARAEGLHALIRDDNPAQDTELAPSSWVLLSRDAAQLKALAGRVPATPLRPLAAPATRVWTDDHASILPHVKWSNLTGYAQ
ncbi:fused MFS/spermidine synthase [Novosphingobium sp. TH158]|uniref:fused MFS/spermidine synthase n=1 Tax=Novosphingobium sp. TH158 TaxID=2067455 RepID=UPI000C79CBD0|nr:fused MFS/spermidine synthase [Novosphingobium sp. TH158]PLK27192.1 hypothetical protein C0V78_10075 [Novosphingobium sp. TH158]